MSHKIIKINRYFFIHPFCILIFVVSAVTHNFVQVALLYFVVSVHELFHFIACTFFNVKIRDFTIMPFGLTIRTKNNFIRKPEQEIIIAIAGPLANVLMILIVIIMKAYCLLDTDNMTFFITANIAIIFINIVPALPLDGGRILKSVLILGLGTVRAFQLMDKITKVAVFMLFMLGIYVFYMTGFNFSIILIASFLISNLFSERKNNHLILMKEILYCKEKLSREGICKTKQLVVLYNIPAQKLLKYFSYNYFSLITVIDRKMNIMGTLTEVQVIEGLGHFDSQVEIGKIIEWYC